MNAKYRVVIWKYEVGWDGWDSKPVTHKDFDSFKEAQDLEFNEK